MAEDLVPFHEIGCCWRNASMPNALRVHVPGVSLHLRQRGNNHCAIFGDDSDYESFLVMLQSAMQRYEVEVHGYALMTTHTHLQVTPRTEHGTAKAMQQLGIRYVMYFNRKYERVGTLWTGRYKAKAIADERYWLTCLRYIEQNPVRAGIVVRPEHTGGRAIERTPRVTAADGWPRIRCSTHWVQT